MAKIIDDETMENVCILAKLSLSEEEKEKAKAEMQKFMRTLKVGTYLEMMERQIVRLCGTFWRNWMNWIHRK